MCYDPRPNASCLATGMMSSTEQWNEHHDQRGSRAVVEGELLLMSDYPFLDPQLRTADKLPICTASLDMLDLDKVAAHIAKAVKLGRYHSSVEPFEYPLLKQCVEPVEQEQYATLPGILCFGRDPLGIFPQCRHQYRATRHGASSHGPQGGST